MQILKEEVRKKIIDSAVDEFIEKGYDNASMRNIAKKAGITVGNIYRYFESKEKILIEIVDPVLIKLDFFMKDVTNNELDLMNLPNNNNKILFENKKTNSWLLLTSFSRFIIELFKDHNKEIIILLTNEETLSNEERNIDLNNWLLELFRVNFKFENNKTELTKEDNIYIYAIKKSFVSGLVEIVRNCDSKVDAKEILERYIRFYF